VTQMVRASLLAIGALAVVAGVIFMGQGSGYFPYPPSSFMIDESVWIWRGLAIAVAGAFLVALSRRV
jgi:hypothetical protein